MTAQRQLLSAQFGEGERLYAKYYEHTMIPEKRFIENIECISWVKAQPNFPAGTIVECGVWRGGMAAALVELFGPEYSYLLFDSFKGLPAPSENDGEDARWWYAHPEHPRYFANCEAPSSVVRDLLRSNFGNEPAIEIVEGWFSETMAKQSIRPISLCHLDCDWYDSYTVCLNRLWPQILPGGAIIIDDYYDWEGCRRAVHEFLASVRAREAIERIGKTGGAFIRRLGPWDLSESPHLG